VPRPEAAARGLPDLRHLPAAPGDRAIGMMLTGLGGDRGKSGGVKHRARPGIISEC
jgi:hypothetical protein